MKPTALSNQSPKELVSVSGKRIFAGRDKRAGVAPKANFAFEGDKSRARTAANSGHSVYQRSFGSQSGKDMNRRCTDWLEYGELGLW